MNPYKQQQFIEAIKIETGWIYDKLPWFSSEDARIAEKQRLDLLNRLAGVLNYSFNGTKPHLGPLSRGCKLCGTPSGIFHFINRNCTRTCFFCPQDRKQNPDLMPWTDNMWFEDDEIFIHFLKTFRINRVGFTGGEPLLVLDKLLNRIRAIRQHLDPSVYLWLNTNGDLASEQVLNQLQEAGLDEIKYNISAQNYDLSSVEHACGRIPIVTVEIPAIPEHLDTMKKVMGKMETLGVNYLNLIQLEVSRDNYKSLDLERYHLIPRPTLLAVFESELCALELMLYSHENGMQFPISYCGFPYRFEVTNAMRSKRYNQFGLKSWEEVTKAGIIRTLVIEKSKGSLKTILTQLNKANNAQVLWVFDSDRNEIYFHPKMLPIVLESNYRIKIKYHEKSLTSFSLHEQEWESNLLAEIELSRPAIECWRQIYLECHDIDKALRIFSQEYPLSSKHQAELLAKECKVLRQIGIWEQLDAKFPESLF